MTGWACAFHWRRHHYFYGQSHSACGRVAVPLAVATLGDTPDLDGHANACGLCRELAPLIRERRSST